MPSLHIEQGRQYAGFLTFVLPSRWDNRLYIDTCLVGTQTSNNVYLDKKLLDVWHRKLKPIKNEVIVVNGYRYASRKSYDLTSKFIFSYALLKCVTFMNEKFYQGRFLHLERELRDVFDKENNFSESLIFENLWCCACAYCFKTS